jgi:8-oxo-dGTP pyrophosphatase MutT (NUDIX family)
MDTSWRTLSSETIVKDRWIDLRADVCVTPGGQKISPYYVLNFPDWVHVVAITARNELVLIRQYRHGAGQSFLELPAGTMEQSDADPAICAVRELEEETGYRAHEMRPVITLYANPANQSNRVHVYLAIGAELVGERRLDHGEEGLSVHLIPVREVVDQIHTGIIQQALQVSSLLLGLSAAGQPAFSQR